MPSSIHVCLECGKNNDFPVGFRGDFSCQFCGGKLHDRKQSKMVKRTNDLRNRASKAASGDSIWENSRSKRGGSQWQPWEFPFQSKNDFQASRDRWRNSQRQSTWCSWQRHEPSVQQNWRSYRGLPRKKDNRGFFAALIAIGFIYVAHQAFTTTGGSAVPIGDFTAAEEAPSSANEPDRGVVWNQASGQPRHPFKITTPAGKNYLVQLVNVNNPDATIGIYAKAESTTEVLQPSGTYDLKFAYGARWKDRQSLFGGWGQTTTGQALAPLEFKTKPGRIMGRFVDFNGRINGNMPTRPINRGSF